MGPRVRTAKEQGKGDREEGKEREHTGKCVTKHLVIPAFRCHSLEDGEFKASPGEFEASQFPRDYQGGEDQQGSKAPLPLGRIF